MFDRFTERARKVMHLARQEALQLNHEYIGTEHVLLGIVKEGTGVAASVLEKLNVDLKKIRMDVGKLVQGGSYRVTMGMLPFTPRAKKALELTLDEARSLGHNYIGTEHLLLGLLREQEGVAAQVLMNLGVKLDEVRKQILDYLGPSEPPEAGKTGKASEGSASTPEREEALHSEKERLSREKEKAVAAQDFERAAKLRDELEQLAKKLEATEPALAVSRKVEAFRQAIRDRLEEIAGPESFGGGESQAVRRGSSPWGNMFDRFTECAKNALHLSRQEALRLNHEYIGTEHLLLGVIKEGTGVAISVLRKLGADLKLVRLEIEKLARISTKEVAAGELPFTPGAKKVLEFSLDEARAFGHNYIGTEHLLLGLLRVQEGIAAHVLLGPADGQPAGTLGSSASSVPLAPPPEPPPPAALGTLTAILQGALVLAPMVVGFGHVWAMRPNCLSGMNALGGMTSWPVYVRFFAAATEPFRFFVLASLFCVLALWARQRKDGGWMFIAFLYGACIFFVCAFDFAFLYAMTHVQAHPIP